MFSSQIVQATYLFTLRDLMFIVAHSLCSLVFNKDRCSLSQKDCGTLVLCGFDNLPEAKSCPIPYTFQVGQLFLRQRFSILLLITP